MVKHWSDASRAAAWMVLASVSFAGLWGLIRLGSASFHPFALVFYRNLFGIIVLTPMLLRLGSSLLETQRIKLHGARATSGVIATFGTFYAVANAPMADAMAINYGAPLFATIGAVLFLGERIRLRRIMALLIGFLGVLIVLRPGHLPFTPGIAAAVIAAIATAFSVIAMKRLSGTEDGRAVVAYSFLLMLPPSALIAAPFLRLPTLPELALLMGMGVLATLGQTAAVRAFKLAEATAVLPYDFIRFGLVIAIAVLGFGEPFDLMTLLGGSLILLSTVYMAHREAVAARTPGPASTPRLN